jgi:hypothetical protein
MLINRRSGRECDTAMVIAGRKGNPAPSVGIDHDVNGGGLIALWPSRSWCVDAHGPMFVTGFADVRASRVFATHRRSPPVTVISAVVSVSLMCGHTGTWPRSSWFLARMSRIAAQSLAYVTEGDQGIS